MSKVIVSSISLDLQKKLFFIFLFQLYFLFQENSTLNHLIFSLLLFILIAITKISLKKIFLFFKYLYLYLLFIFFINYHSSDFLTSFNKLLHLLNFILVAFIFTYTTKMSDMIESFQNILTFFNVKEKIKMKISLALALVIRFLPILLIEWEEFKKAYELRGGKPKFSFLIIPSFIIKTLKQSDFYAEALHLKIQD